jgi:hypothetical protein
MVTANKEENSSIPVKPGIIWDQAGKAGIFPQLFGIIL